MVRRDEELTRMMGFTDKRSYVHASRVHPGTSHRCQYLAGDDVAQIRRVIYDRDNHRCQLRLVCTGVQPLPFEGSIYERAHLEHEKGGNGLQRCWCHENVRISCYACHVVKDGRQPRWSKP